MTLRGLVEELPSCCSWKTPACTGSIFGLINIFFIFFTFSNCTVVELVSKSAFYGTLFTTLYAFVLSFVHNKPFPNKENQGTNKEFVSQACVQSFVVRLTNIINAIKNEFVQATSDLTSLVKFLATAYFLSVVGGWFSLPTWTWIIVNFLFTITAVKKFKGVQVADYIDSIYDVALGVVQTGLNYIPRYKVSE